MDKAKLIKINNTWWPAVKIALIYAFVGSVWIMASDQLLGFSFNDSEMLMQLGTVKGWFYIVTTAVLLFWLIRRQLLYVNEKEKYNRVLFETITTGLVLCRMNGELIDINRAYAQLLGCSVKEALLLNYWDITPQEYVEHEQHQLSRLGDTERYGPYEKEYIHKDGHRISVSLSSTILEKNGERYIWSSVEDITDRKHMEHELHENAERFNSWKESNFIGIIHSRADGEVLDANNTLLNMLGYSHQDLRDGALDWTKFTPAEFLYLDDRAIKEAGEKGYWTPFEKEYFHKGGNRVPILIGGSAFHKGGDEFIVFIVDLTEQKQQEEKIRRTQKMDALGKLTGGVAHDYNNMLGVIMGYSDLLEDALSNQPVLAKYAQEIHHASERGAKLTKKLLSFSRQRAPEATCLNLNALLKNQQLMLEKTLTARIKLVFELLDNLWLVWLDDGDMEDVILNISINAMHAIEGNGRVTIQTGNKVINQIDAKQLGIVPGDYILFSVTDTGCGIDDETMERIFEPFFSTKGKEGTGLGLSQVYGFVRNNGGAINAFSESGHGTRITLYFPRYISQCNEQLAEDRHIIEVKGKETILVVDDEPVLLNLNSEILGNHGFNVICTESAKNALHILETETVDLLISDIIMPEMDGYQLAAIVKKKYSGIKIQLMSGFTGDRVMRITDEGLQQKLLLKPFSSQNLLQRVHDLLHEA